MEVNKILVGDCLIKLKELEDNSVDSIVTDPPYELGFMGKSWDNTGIANNQEMWKECLRVLKPGGHLLAFSGTRTYHRMAVAIEDAGFEVRDMIEWVYGSGFPKSLNIGKAVDKLQGNEREDIGEHEPFGREGRSGNGKAKFGVDGWDTKPKVHLTKGTSPYEGWGTALKPSHEPVVFCSKPLTPRLYFAILIGDISNNIIQLCQISNVKNAEKISLDFQAKLEKEEVLSVADNVKMNAWESLENVRFAEQNFISNEQKSSDLIKTKESSVQLNVKQSGNEDKTQEIKTLAGVEANIKALMDIIIFGIMEDTSQNIASLWNSISEELLNQANTLTIKMATRLITDLKILKLSATQSILESTGSLFKTPQNISPNHEPICMARKPLAEKTVAENVLRYGTGGINIDESRVGTGDDRTQGGTGGHKTQFVGGQLEQKVERATGARFPSNLIHDNSEEVRECFPETNPAKKGDRNPIGKTHGINSEVYGEYKSQPGVIQGHEDNGGNASRFFKSIIYQAKSSKSERNKGLDSYLTVKYNNSISLNKEICKEENMVAVQLLQKVISEQELVNFNIDESGVNIMVQCHKDSLSIILTEIKRIIGLKIYNSLTHSLTNESTQVVNSEMEVGGNLAESVADLKRWILTTTKGNQELALGASRVVCQMLQLISVEENWKEKTNTHSTVKPIALMEYLIKMVTPKGGIVLDPFAGSGSTLVAAKQNGFQYIGIEMTKEYIPIIEARLNAIFQQTLI